MSIIQPPNVGYPDWQTQNNLWGGVLLNHVGALAGGGTVKLPITGISGYRYLAGYVSAQNEPVSIQINWWSDINEDVNTGSTAFALGPPCSTFGYPHFVNQGPFVTLEALNTTGSTTNFICQILGTNVQGNNPFQYEGGMLIEGKSASLLTHTFTGGSAYGGPATLYTQAANGAVTEVDYLDPISGLPVTVWTNAPGSSTADWTKDDLLLPAGAYSVTMTTAVASVLYCNLVANPALVG